VDSVHPVNFIENSPQVTGTISKKGDCDDDGKCMDHTAFPAIIVFDSSSIW
jgi:hypothetical protein